MENLDIERTPITATSDEPYGDSPRSSVVHRVGLVSAGMSMRELTRLPVASIRRPSTALVPPVAETAPNRATGDHGRLSVAVKGSETELVLAVAGDIDAGSHHRFRDALSTGISRSRNVILDLGAVDSIDSTGLNGIVWACHQACQRGKRLVIRSAPSHVRRLFQLNGLERLSHPDGRPK